MFRIFAGPALFATVVGVGLREEKKLATRAALAQADRVVVLIGGKVEDQGTWPELQDRWGHLAG